MKVFYVTSSRPGEGKTTIIAGLASYFQKQGKKIGYLKPIGLKTGAADGSPDGLFFQDFLKLQEKLDSICPLHLSSNEITELSQKDNLPESILKAFADVSINKDIVFVEGLNGISSAQSEGRIGSRLVNKIGAEVIAVLSNPGDKIEEILSQAQGNFGKNFRGVIFSAMSSGQIEAFKESRLPSLKGKSSLILGFLPRNRALASITLAELVKGLGAKPVNAFDGMEELVENTMVGSHGIDPGLYYYDQRDKKVVILRSDRPDMQVAALQTPSLALFLAGESRTYHETLFQAEITKVPIFTLPHTTTDVIDKIGEIIKPGPFHQIKKVDKVEKLLQENIDLKALF